MLFNPSLYISVIHICIDHNNKFSDENLMALASSLQKTLVKLKLKNCLNLQNVVPLFEHCKFLKYLDLTDCSCIKEPGWIVPIVPAMIFPQSLSNVRFREISNFDSVITLNSHFFTYYTDKSIFDSEHNT